MKKIIFAFSALALMGVIVFSCTKPEPEKLVLDAPVISAAMVGETVSVSWSPITNATGYKVEYKKASDAEFMVAGSPTYSPFVVTDFDFGNVYEFRAKATCGDVESPYSNVVSVEVAKYLPQPVIQVTPGIGFLNVEWEAVEGATSYQVDYKLALDSEYTMGYSGTETSCKLTGLECGVAYNLRVGAIAEGYAMSYCDVATIATTAAPSTVISNAAQFVAWLGSINGETTDVAALAADIDMTGVELTSAKGFFGELQGQGFAIKNLQSSVPIFAKNSGKINDLVIDESCVFTASSHTFAPLVAEDSHGQYVSVKNKASVTYTATADVTEPVILGGLVALSSGGSFEKCSNWGAVTFDATDHSHVATALGGLVGLMNNKDSGGSFDSCVNYGHLTLQALYGDPNTSFNADWDCKGINMGGILGACVYGDGRISFESCQNATSGTITFRHAEIDKLARVEDSTGPLGIGGIMGFGDRADFNKCKNYALIDVKAKVSADGAFTENESSEKKRRNYLMQIGGISGYGWDATGGHSSCTNEGDIEVDYDGVYSADDKWRAAVGGICGSGYRSSTDGYAYYCKQRGNITVTGRGVMAVGGIFGTRGKQIENTVEASCHITVNGLKGDVGGLVGYVEGGSANYTIRGCKCYATIFADSIWGEAGKDFYYHIGGLMGRWSGAQSSNPPSMADYNADPCVFSGSVSSVYQVRVGLLIGYVYGDNRTIKFGTSEHPIQASGTITRKELAETTITQDNLATYAVGATSSTATADIYAEYAAPAAE